MATSLRKTLIIVTGEEGLFPSDTLYPSDELFPGARIVENIVDGTLKLDEILSESPIQFGQMYATKFEVQVYLEEDLSGKWIQVYQYDGTAYREVFSGKIDSCKLDKIGTDRTIVAYDKAYTFGQINIASWWKTYWTNRETATLKQVREAMLDNFGIESVKTKALVNDNLVVKKDVAFDSCSLTDMLRMMCEISCCFPHIGRDGILEYITLDPNPTAKDLSELYEWMNSEFEDFETDTITGVQFYDSGDQLKWTVGTATNAYPIQKNVFLYDAVTTTLNTVGTAILNAISSIKYTPSSIKMIQSDFTIKLGDYVETAIGSFYVLENSYSGTQMVEQTLKASGDQKQYDGTPTFDYSDIILNERIARINYSIEVLETEFTQKMTGLFANYKEDYIPIPNETTSSPANSPASDWISAGTQAYHVGEVFCYVQTSTDPVTGKTIYTETYYRYDYVNGNYRWTLLDTTNGAYTVISSTFKQTADEIATEVSRATGAEESMFANYKGAYVPTTSNSPASSWTTDSLKAQHEGETFYKTNATKGYYRWTKSNGTYSWQPITLDNSNFYVVSSAIKQTADAITSEVTRATGAESSLSSRITQTADAIALKVSKSDLVSELNSQLLITGNKIELSTDGKIIINGTNFSVDANGHMEAHDAVLYGSVTSTYTDSYGTSETYIDQGYISLTFNSAHAGGIYSRDYTELVDPTAILTIAGDNRGVRIRPDINNANTYIDVGSTDILLQAFSESGSIIDSEIKIASDVLNLTDAGAIRVKDASNREFDGLTVGFTISGRTLIFVNGILVEQYT